MERDIYIAREIGAREERLTIVWSQLDNFFLLNYGLSSFLSYHLVVNGKSIVSMTFKYKFRHESSHREIG